MLGKSLFEIANSEGNVGLGLPGAYCVRTSAHRNTTRRGEERNRLLGISSLRSSSDGILGQRFSEWDTQGSSSNIPLDLVGSANFSHPGLSELETLEVGSSRRG